MGTTTFLALGVLLLGVVLHAAELRACATLARRVVGSPLELPGSCFAYGTLPVHRRNNRLREIAKRHPAPETRALARQVLNLALWSRLLLTVGIALVVVIYASP